MKKQFFTFLMMIALVIVAGSAMAANEKNVFPGGTYTYNLTGIGSVNAASTTVTYDGDNVTITPVSGYAIAANTVNGTISFELFFDDSPLATSGKILVVIDDATSGCSNSIEYSITVLPMPSYTLSIAASIAETCQVRTGADDNLADARGTEDNSFTFTVTPVIANIPTGMEYTYSYDITLPSNAVLTGFTNVTSAVTGYSPGEVTYTLTRTALADEYSPDVFTVAFKTTTGAATQSIQASLPLTNSTLVPNNGGTGSYTATNGGNLSASVSVKAVPKIGSFLP